MYTLEDDKETTSSLRKRDFDSTSQAPDGSGGAATGALHHPSLSTQVTSSFKKITTIYSHSRMTATISRSSRH